jgi:hypothetical protein
VHHAVSHGFNQSEDRHRFKPVQQKTHRRAVVGGSKAENLRFSIRIIDDQIRTAQTNAIDLPPEQPPRRFARLVHCEPDAR